MLYERGVFIKACYDIFFNEIIEYVTTNEEPARFFEKIIRIRIIDKIRYPLILITINTERANVIDKV